MDATTAMLETINTVTALIAGLIAYTGRSYA